MMVTAIRYDDIYRNTADGWKIADRTINFLYYVPVAEYPDILRTLDRNHRSEEHTSELQSLMRISYAVFCLKKKKKNKKQRIKTKIQYINNSKITLENTTQVQIK